MHTRLGQNGETISFHNFEWKAIKNGPDAGHIEFKFRTSREMFHFIFDNPNELAKFATELLIAREQLISFKKPKS